jgi:hypothetical protein
MKVPKAAPGVSPLAVNLVVHETRWSCWPAVGGCGHVFGLNFPGGPCPECGKFAVTRAVFLAPAGRDA